MDLPLNALRAFEVSARHLSFTRAAGELNLTPTAVSQHVKNLESRFGMALFRRLPRGLALTEEGQALLPVLAESFERIGGTLATLREARPREVLALGVVATFAIGWLLPRLQGFQQAHPYIDLRLSTHNNRVDLAAEGLDAAVRFGDGHWHGTEALPLMRAPLAPVCAPALATRIRTPRDLGRETLLRSYRADEWQTWFRAAGVEPPVVRGMVFDASLALAEAAALGAGVALLPVDLFIRDLRNGRLVRLFDVQIDSGRYWLTRLGSRKRSAALQAFEAWISAECDVL
ncbi:LysR family transcriptional regulator [Ideonella azotifigens]|uniref:LysR family transcriptional regulator n=3 Tax=Ideonella azotifigens TaxID=513160 RepID=A0ABN1KC82_9BURK|nr:LysR family transcriptional regulator [Ideonella azotifigens]MCD2343096.1 LysR family transcriptional regulator [Ideonella azotifigens]